MVKCRLIKHRDLYKVQKSVESWWETLGNYTTKRAAKKHYIAIVRDIKLNEEEVLAQYPADWDFYG